MNSLYICLFLKFPSRRFVQVRGKCSLVEFYLVTKINMVIKLKKVIFRSANLLKEWWIQACIKEGVLTWGCSPLKEIKFWTSNGAFWSYLHCKAFGLLLDVTTSEFMCEIKSVGVRGGGLESDPTPSGSAPTRWDTE